MASKLTQDQLAHYSESKQGSITGALVIILCLGNLSFAEDYLIAFAVVNHINSIREGKRLTVEQLCSNAVIALFFVDMLHHYRQELRQESSASKRS